jgi:hypothetical protein
MGGTSAPLDPISEIEVVVTHAVSGSCPQVRFDGLAVDHGAGVVEAQLTDVHDLLFVGGCSADANPVVFWLAVERAYLPADGFTLRSEKAPDVTTVVPPGE